MRYIGQCGMFQWLSFKYQVDQYIWSWVFLTKCVWDRIEVLWNHDEWHMLVNMFTIILGCKTCHIGHFLLLPTSISNGWMLEVADHRGHSVARRSALQPKRRPGRPKPGPKNKSKTGRLLGQWLFLQTGAQRQLDRQRRRRFFAMQSCDIILV